ncbi:hypothetical protein ACMBCM_05845, partial [Spiroplasma sp. K1]
MPNGYSKVVFNWESYIYIYIYIYSYINIHIISLIKINFKCYHEQVTWVENVEVDDSGVHNLY